MCFVRASCDRPCLLALLRILRTSLSLFMCSGLLAGLFAESGKVEQKAAEQLKDGQDLPEKSCMILQLKSAKHGVFDSARKPATYKVTWMACEHGEWRWAESQKLAMVEVGGVRKQGGARKGNLERRARRGWLDSVLRT